MRQKPQVLERARTGIEHRSFADVTSPIVCPPPFHACSLECMAASERAKGPTDAVADGGGGHEEDRSSSNFKSRLSEEETDGRREGADQGCLCGTERAGGRDRNR